MLKDLKIKILIMFVIALGTVTCVSAAEPAKAFTIARVWYQGGGDWYNDPSVIPNLLKYIAGATGMRVATTEARIKLTDERLFSYPILYLTGHGNIVFSETEVRNLRKYLIHGGFLYADDDYGMDKYFRREIKKVFPGKKLVELPRSHSIYHIRFNFPKGLPKTHEHYPGPPRGYGIFYNGRMVVYYTYNTNISDGWADPHVHNDPEPVRIQALKMGVNIVIWALFN
ncbi:hypothetical protein BMS3Abin05_01695 [bacterium BMS3Abin05]|nr:hypothetical protein BMS3Abin05_01695 [bacterium BMS3Abin05]GBE28492.1 hypothetical protein BMS3Bbin03_02431 [bacterium BMS3Bbin03]